MTIKMAPAAIALHSSQKETRFPLLNSLVEKDIMEVHQLKLRNTYYVTNATQDKSSSNAAFLHTHYLVQCNHFLA